MNEKVERILEAIPYDSWVSAAEIAAETGIDSQKVGNLIRRDLLNVYVKRKSSGLYERGRYLYRRLPWVAAPAGPGGEVFG